MPAARQKSADGCGEKKIGLAGLRYSVSMSPARSVSPVLIQSGGIGVAEGALSSLTWVGERKTQSRSAQLEVIKLRASRPPDSTRRSYRQASKIRANTAVRMGLPSAATRPFVMPMPAPCSASRLWRYELSRLTAQKMAVGVV